MAEAFFIVQQGLKNLPGSGELSDRVRTASFQAVNRVAASARTRAERQMLGEVAFPAQYLKPGAGRLTVSSLGTKKDPTATITGRERPTSLARFTRGAAKPGQTGVTVEVKPGQARYLRRAFLIRLKSGTASTETRSNLGLAVRLPKGEKLKGRKTNTLLKNGLYLLYAPSVAQVFRSVSDDIASDVADDLMAEFMRLMRI